MSVFGSVADLLDPPAPEGALIWYCDVPDCDGLPHDGVEYPHARAAQHPPSSLEWFIWLLLCGRGFGKTRTGAEWLVDRMKKLPNTYWALVAPTFDDGRDTMVEGESGLEFVLDRHKVRYDWNRSLGQLTLHNNARLDLFSSKSPESLRGPNLTGAWGDEPASWIYPESTWDNLLLMCRKGNPQIVLTGTPLPSKFVKMLKAEADYITTGSSHDNRHNLAQKWYDKVVKPLEGTRKGLQEIYGKILEDVEGALWVSEQIDESRLILPKRFERIIVAVDPSVSKKSRDECGITVGGLKNNHGFLLADRSMQGPPDAWATAVIEAYDEFNADIVVGEVNNGGDLVDSVLRAKRANVHFKTVHASRGKIARAEPVAALYGDPTNPATWANSVVHHAKGENFGVLEEQMTTYVQGDKDSPDRMDSLVWLFSEMFNIKPTGKGRGGLRYRR